MGAHIRIYCWDDSRLYAECNVTAHQPLEHEDDQRDTEDLEEADTEDVESEDELRKATAPTEPDSNPKRSPRRIRMPSKVEIMKAVESVSTESLDVDDVTREQAMRLPEIVDEAD